MIPAMFNILVRAILKRVKTGESLDTVLEDYPNLDEDTKVQIKNSVLANL